MTADANTRRAKLAALHILKAEQGLEDDDYRDKLERITGKRSAADLSPVELDRALNGFHVKQNTNKAYTGKLKALWIAAFNLGTVTDGSDRALDAFIANQTGKARIAFLSPADANKVTEALKAICARRGFVVAGTGDGMEARRKLLLAQWLRLFGLDQVKIESPDALASYLSRKYLGHTGSLIHMTKEQLDDCARAFGRWIRKAQAEIDAKAARA